MHHGKRIWQKKLGQSPKARMQLQRVLMTQLVQHEQIQTTLAKAQFIQHRMEELVNQCKKNQFSTAKKQLLNNASEKLINIIVPRFKGRAGGYIRILKNGYNSSGSDRASRVIIEFVGNNKDIVHHMSKIGKEKLEKLLADVQNKRYHINTIELYDPITGNPTTIKDYKVRQDLDGKTVKKLATREKAIASMISKYTRNDKFFEIARQSDEKQMQTNINVAPSPGFVKKIREPEPILNAESTSAETPSPESETMKEEEKRGIVAKLFGNSFKFWK